MASRLTQIIKNNNARQKYTVGREEHKTFVIILGDSGGQQIEKHIEIELAEGGAQAQILGIVIGRGEESIMLNTLQKHVAPNTTSDLLVKGVFFDESKLKYRGLIEIAKNAQSANAFQQQNNLVLSDEVDLDTRPELEIKANEIRCTHSATVAPIDKEQLYYMRTRGLSEEKAKELIVDGFLNEVVDRISNSKVKEKAKSMVRRLLGDSVR